MIILKITMDDKTVKGIQSEIGGKQAFDYAEYGLYSRLVYLIMNQ